MKFLHQSCCCFSKDIIEILLVVVRHLFLMGYGFHTLHMQHTPGHRHTTKLFLMERRWNSRTCDALHNMKRKERILNQIGLVFVNLIYNALGSNDFRCIKYKLENEIHSINSTKEVYFCEHNQAEEDFQKFSCTMVIGCLTFFFTLSLHIL